MPAITYIDSHAHIYADQFEPDRVAAIGKATAAGVARILMPNIDHTSVEALLRTENDFPGTCLAMMGLHPCSVTRYFEKELYEAESWLQRRPFCAIGETGIDSYWDKTFLAQQQEALKIQIGWAKQYSVPIVLHTREAFAEVFELIQQAQDGTLQGIFHCFSGSPAEAAQVLEVGFYLGIGGVATFKNGGLDKVLPEVPLDKILLETDCPYLAPAPHRGKRNEPAYLPLIAERVAALMQLPVAEVAEKTTANTNKLFNLKHAIT
jgi:TatD DNase family protein